MVAIKFCKRDFMQYRAICVALKQMRAELLDIKSRCTIVDTVQDYSTGFQKQSESKRFCRTNIADRQQLQRLGSWNWSSGGTLFTGP